MDTKTLTTLNKGAEMPAGLDKNFKKLFNSASKKLCLLAN